MNDRCLTGDQGGDGKRRADELDTAWANFDDQLTHHPEGENFTLIETGVVMYQGLTEPTSWWIDDLAIGPERIGCVALRAESAAEMSEAEALVSQAERSEAQLGADRTSRGESRKAAAKAGERT